MSKIFSATVIKNRDNLYEVELTNEQKTQRLDAIELSQYISELSNLRLQILPTVPMEFPRIEGMENVANNPPWICAYDQMNERTALAIRHPGYGWVGFSMSMQSAAQLAERLTQIVSSSDNQRQEAN